MLAILTDSLSLYFTLFHSISLYIILYHSLSLSITLYLSLSLSISLYHSLSLSITLYHSSISHPLSSILFHFSSHSFSPILIRLIHSRRFSPILMIEGSSQHHLPGQPGHQHHWMLMLLNHKHHSVLVFLFAIPYTGDYTPTLHPLHYTTSHSTF